jgi:predicted ArsR family transcriptional regulator
MTFQSKFTNQDFLAVLDTKTAKTTTQVGKDVGAVRNTAFRFLQRLEKEGLVKQVTVEGGARAWVRITREPDKDSLLRLVDE